MTEFEKSCGAVIFKQEAGRRLYLTVEYKIERGYWGLVKGHVEPGETEHQTARREIWEEVGLKDLSFINGFRAEITYSPKPGVDKLVVFFLAQANLPGAGKINYLWGEHVAHDWLAFDEISRRLTYETDRGVAAKAEAFLADAEAL